MAEIDTVRDEAAPAPIAEVPTVQFKLRLGDGTSYIICAARMIEDGPYFAFLTHKDEVICRAAKDCVALVGRWSAIENEL
jgi:hypothetical protein